MPDTHDCSAGISGKELTVQVGPSNLGQAVRKPWLSPLQLVECLKSKGVKFELMSEGEACNYLA